MILGDNRAVEILVNALPGPIRDGVTVDKTRPEPVVNILLGTQHTTLIPIWAGEGFPADVKTALRARPEPRDTKSHLVVVARRISAGARRLLNEQGIDWVEEAGDARIWAPPGLLIERDHSSRKAPTRTSEFRWSGSIGAVAEALLVRASAHSHDLGPGNASNSMIPRPAEIAEETGWSYAQVSKALQSFDAQGWTTKSGGERGPGSRRDMVSPGELLSSWAAWHMGRRLESVGAHATWVTPSEFVSRMTQNALVRTWALSGWAGLDIVAPFSSDVPSTTCYLDGPAFDHDLDRLLNDLELRRVTTGARVTFIRAEGHVLRESDATRPEPIVSDIRLYGDLLRLKVRGDDAAEHLREQRIGF